MSSFALILAAKKARAQNSSLIHRGILCALASTGGVELHGARAILRWLEFPANAIYPLDLRILLPELPQLIVQIQQPQSQFELYCSYLTLEWISAFLSKEQQQQLIDDLKQKQKMTHE